MDRFKSKDIRAPAEAVLYHLPQLRKSGGNAVDGRVGRQLRARRIKHGIEAEALALAVGVSICELHQFEMGTTRIGGKILLELCDILNCAPAYFFEETEIQDADDRLT